MADAGTELPCIDGLSPTARLIVEALLRLTAPGERASYQAISRTLLEDHPTLTPQRVAHTVELLARQAWPLLDQQRDTSTTSLTQLGRDFLTGRLSAPMLLLNGVETAEVFFPPLVASEVIDAALSCLAAGDTHAVLDLSPSYRAGCSRSRAPWSSGEAELTIMARTSLFLRQRGEGRGEGPRQAELPVLVRIESFPRADLIPEFLRRFEARRDSGEFDGVKTVRREGDDVVLELDHPLFAACTVNELAHSGLIAWRHLARLEVREPNGIARLSVAEVISRFVRAELTRAEGTPENHAALVNAAVEAETLVVALSLLEPVLLAMRPSLDDREAVDALMHFMRPEHRAVIDALPCRPSHPYVTGFTEEQARRLVTHRKLRARSLGFAVQDWKTAMDALAEREQASAEARTQVKEALVVARLRLFRPQREPYWSDVSMRVRARRG